MANFAELGNISYCGKEAQEIFDNFFKSFPKVEELINSLPKEMMTEVKRNTVLYNYSIPFKEDFL